VQGRPVVVITCMSSSSESWEPQHRSYLWHSSAGGEAVHSIKGADDSFFVRWVL
jgi:hypothetical protein